MEPLLTVDDVAALLGVSRDAVYDLAESRDPCTSLPAVRLGRRLRFRSIDVAAYIDRQVSDNVLVST